METLKTVKNKYSKAIAPLCRLCKKEMHKMDASDRKCQNQLLPACIQPYRLACRPAHSWHSTVCPVIGPILEHRPSFRLHNFMK